MMHLLTFSRVAQSMISRLFVLLLTSGHWRNQFSYNAAAVYTAAGAAFTPHATLAVAALCFRKCCAALAGIRSVIAVIAQIAALPFLLGRASFAQAGSAVFAGTGVKA